jgi:predicted dehydrogenase
LDSGSLPGQPAWRPYDEAPLVEPVKSAPVSVALLGLGFAGAQLHLPALRRLSVPIALVVDPDLGTHARARGARISQDWRDVIDSAARAVVVATPAENHAELGLACLRAAKHVYIEKPMATTREEAAELTRMAASAGRVLQVGYAYRFHPLWQQLRGLVSRGWLSPPLTFEAQFTKEQPGSGWRDPLLDLAGHHVDLASWLLGAAPTMVRVREDRLDVGWDDGSVLRGHYSVGAPIDRVRVQAGRRTVVVDRLAGWRLHGETPFGARVPPASLAWTRTIGRGWERSFEWAMAAFLRAVSTHETGAGSQVQAARGLDECAGPDVGVLGVEVAHAMIRSRASKRSEPVARP